MSEEVLSPARNYWRGLLLPRIEKEVEYVVNAQKSRNAFLDQYYRAWSFMGSHTTYIIGLPLIFWLGDAFYARHLTMLMGIGLVLCNIVKDALCLPRPYSPPVQRLSKTHHLEYGFPSSHSVNALNLPLFTVVYLLYHSSYSFSWFQMVLLFATSFFVTYSISYSRIYCGMHCPTDLMGGFAIGALLLAAWLYYLQEIEEWMTKGQNIELYCLSVMSLFLYLYPSPMTSTPTFDDSVSFSFTLVGIVIGTNYFSAHPFSIHDPFPGNFRFALENASWLLIAARIVVGVLMIVSWRAIGKALCKLVIPPIFNFFDYSATSSPSDSNLAKQRFELRRFDVLTVSRIIVYLGVGLITAYLGAFVYHHLGLDLDY